jgi:iron complex transport system substrate-binding protein
MIRRFAFLIALLFAVSCTTGDNPIRTFHLSVTASPNAAAFPASVTDFQGRSVAIAKRPERIVSIGPSNTEFLFALGAGDRIVGDDDFSDEPAAAKTKEHVGGVKVNLEKIVSLKPDLILTVKFSDGTIEALSQSSAAVLVVDPQGAADVARSATLIGQAIGADGAKLASDIQKQLDAVKAKTDGAPKLRVFHEVDASDPAKIYTVGPGSFVNDLIALAGGTNVFASAKTAYPTVSGEEIIRSDPDVIVLGDALYGTSIESITSRPGWAALGAVRNRRVYAGLALFGRPGPRLGEAAQEYAKLVHPELFR